MDMWLQTHTCDSNTPVVAHTDPAEYHICIAEIYTPLRHTYSGPFHSLHIPLAVSHRRPQLLLISWVTRHSRWASALGGTAADVMVEEEGAQARNSQHICAPSPLSSTSPPVLYCVTLLRDLVLDSMRYTGPAISSACISKTPTFPAFY